MRVHPATTLLPRGMALMAVLWLIAILSMACMVALRVISFDLEIASAKIHGSRARQIAEMGIAVGCNPMVKRFDPLLTRVNPETNENFEVKITSEGARFDINYLILNKDDELLRSIFISWGIELKDAQALTAALTDWVDPNDESLLNGAEKKDYEKAGRINQPFNRPFYNINEVSLVRGMDLVESLRPDWRNWFTVWSHSPLDINDAPAELIALAADVSVDRAEDIPRKIRGIDGIKDTEDDEPFDNLAAALALIGISPDAPAMPVPRFSASLQESTTRIESIGNAEGAKRKITVIVKNRTGQPILLDRTEEIIP